MHQGFKQMNQLGAMRTPFLFIVDFKKERVEVIPLSDVDPGEILYSVNQRNNIPLSFRHKLPESIEFKKFPVSYSEYSAHFSLVMKNLERGNSYLTNLTLETPVETNLSLQSIFYESIAPYRLWYRNQFVVFSPEIFIQIKNSKIYSFPMKGTIDASVKNAPEEILNNRKESAEHATIVDLIRNDLSMVASDVTVEEYRFIDKIKTNQGELLQVSSKIAGVLLKNYHKHLGDILNILLPAGSISGAPKAKTLEIIEQAEGYQRGYYTGVFGVFDGEELDCGVMIRFIEQHKDRLVFKSGGGITANSNSLDEYHELIQKVYLPFKY